LHPLKSSAFSRRTVTPTIMALCWHSVTIAPYGWGLVASRESLINGRAAKVRMYSPVAHRRFEGPKHLLKEETK
jgi:hypothetical protein